MATKATSETAAKTVEDVQKLLALAQDGSNEDEARNAALAAVQLMKKNDLLVVSRSELSDAQRIAGEARELAAQAKAQGRTNMLVGGLIGFALSRGKLL